jgi:hypothetical protein
LALLFDDLVFGVHAAYYREMASWRNTTSGVCEIRERLGTARK